jgi:queuine tRNA-ribosyltransferase
MLLSWANVQFYQELMEAARQAIASGRFAAFAAEIAALYPPSPDETAAAQA